MKMLIIRPEPAAHSTADKVIAAGHQAIIMPLFSVRPVAWEAPDAALFNGLLITSANALRHGGDVLIRYHHLPLHAIGTATAGTALQMGFTLGCVGDAGLSALLKDIALKYGDARLLWLGGRHYMRHEDDNALIMMRHTVYESFAQVPPPEFASIVAQADCILLHSPRAARHFAQLVEDKHLNRADINLAALSPAIATAAGAGWRRVCVASTPNEEDLLQAACV